LLVENYVKQLLASAGLKFGSPPFGEASPLAGLTVTGGWGKITVKDRLKLIPPFKWKRKRKSLK
jgi:hypothetical protein